ncbi:(E,E)-geranyllinalool synthase [Camellia lanceoleosa]|uniref:(E,E)-geranyllinalool synthase n=1 Tax=Camellia lanceoleosa TaxID=1840588 RepID=A0ACC0GLP8_9ERIC|nr:(E,E)-geranyllinalool synthase [Camellia lanceoleosa]
MHMESSLFSIETLVKNIKEEMFTNFDLYSFVSKSAYDTAWLAMIPSTQHCDHPMFKGCLDWILNNQKEEGFWGELDSNGVPSIDCLPATLACMVALKMWNVGDTYIKKGLAFVHENAEILLREKQHNLPRWFAIVFPAMVELAQETGFDVAGNLNGVLSHVFYKRQQILKMDGLVDNYHYHPLLSYLEALPSTSDIDRQVIVKQLSEDGSLFRSPSATACAFMATRDRKCKEYLQSLVQRCPYGVPPMYPMDEEIIKLCLVNQIIVLGLAEYFKEEIEEILSKVYRSYKKQGLQGTNLNFIPAKIYKDSLAFRLLRMHGYNHYKKMHLRRPNWRLKKFLVAERCFCWFVHHEDILAHIENNSGHFMSAMFNVYRATDLTFSGEYELGEARSFSRKLLEKNMMLRNEEDDLVMITNFQTLVKHELHLPWIARMDHLDHRFWIEANNADSLWVAKASLYRLSCLHNDKLMKLAVENYKFRQSIYQNELEEVKRWSKDWCLSDVGFGREKTTYCYFAVAVSNNLPYDSIIRLIVAKSAILITVADDFFDMKGSLKELKHLTEAVQRWDGNGLSGHGKIIFDALEDLVSDIGNKHLHQQGSDITKNLKDIWQETFASWFVEATWSNNGYIPSMHEYLDIGAISIAAHTIVLPASCFLNPKLPNHKLKCSQYETITKLLMVTTRLLNDIQSYQKEQLDGKTNLVLIHFKGYPQSEIEDSIAYVKEILEEKKRELLEHALMDDRFNDLPKPCKLLHLSCLKVFQMFFNSSNLFDSNTELLDDVKKAICIPPEYQIHKPLKAILPFPSRSEKKNLKVLARFIENFKYQHFTRIPSRVGFEKVVIPPKFKLCFV